jgi:cysteine desulfurase
MHVNNETGARYDVPRLFAAAKRKYPNLLTHTDCVQAFGKIPLSATSLGADLITLSAHKIGGPKGVGALYISERVRRTKAISPVIFGGGQELGLRSGTENTIGIAGFGAAAETIPSQLAEMERVSALRARLLAALPAEIVANQPAVAAPHILSITLPHIKSETMLNLLSGKGICVSAGSACASHGKGGSPTLLAFGLTNEQADTTLRISLSHTTTDAEIDAFLSALTEGLRTLVRIS